MPEGNHKLLAGLQADLLSVSTTIGVGLVLHQERDHRMRTRLSLITAAAITAMLSGQAMAFTESSAQKELAKSAEFKIGINVVRPTPGTGDKAPEEKPAKGKSKAHREATDAFITAHAPAN